MEDEIFKVKSNVKILPVKNPWIFVDIPEKYTEMLKGYANRGLVAIRVTLGKSTWDTSLRPMGNGTQFADRQQ